MQDKCKLLSRMESREALGPPLLQQQLPVDPLQQEITLLNRSSQETRIPSLLARLSNPPSLREPLLNPTHNPIGVSLSTAMTSLNDIGEEKSLKQPSMSRSIPNSSTPLEMIGRELTLPLDHSSQLSRAMTPKSTQRPGMGERSTRNSAPPALLYRLQMDTSPMENQVPRRSKWTSQHSHGPQISKADVPSCETPLIKLSNSSNYTPLILKRLSGHSLTSQIVPSSQIQNGRISSQAELSTLTQSSADSSPPLVTIQRPRNSEISRFPSELSNRQKLSRTEEIGLSPGIGQSEQQFSHSPTGCRNCLAMGNISSTYSQLHTPASTVESSPSIRQSEKGLEMSGTLNYGISKNFRTSKSLTWTRSGYQSLRRALPKMTINAKESVTKIGRKTNLVTSGTTANAVKRKRTAGDYMSATNAKRQDIKEKTVGSSKLATERPKYMQRSVWTGADDSSLCSPTACCTVSDNPLPRPPQEEFTIDAVSTIRNNPHLFKIVTPINVTRFEELLETHPNSSFTQSVCVSLREGFWPWANTQQKEYPATWDFSERPPKTEHEAGFLRDQRDVEIAADRYSESFGTDLLPGMYSTPIHAVPKPRSEKLRLVNDHSAGPFSLNSMIAREDVAGAKMDSIADLIGALLRYRRKHPDKRLVLFKSDVSAAYRRLPLHPLWQIKQIITVDDNRHVDRCTSFGGRASCRHYTAFMGLVLWIAIFIKLISDLFGYIDDNFSFDEEGNVMWYEPYQCYYPTKQTKLLKFWDEISLPHDKAKQEYGPVLRIIGFMVDPELMRVSMDEEDRTRLLQRVSDFSATAPGGTRRTLREFQQLAGWINWSFNVFPLLKPALSNVYAKIGGKTESHAKIFVNKGVVQDLDWFRMHVQRSPGVYLFENVDWDIQQADVVAYSDACLSGLGFYLVQSDQGFQCLVPQSPPKDTIFYFEALAVVSVVDAVTRLHKVPSRLLIFCDNTNTVNIFHSLRSLPPYNNLLKFTVSLLLKYNISLRVMHVPGVENIIADSLSRFENAKAIAECPNLSISSFQPPRVAMGLDL
jgi:hypothetical protein